MASYPHLLHTVLDTTRPRELAEFYRHEVPMQLHLDLTVPDVTELERQRDRALSLGAELLLDRSDDGDEPLYVFADLSGHPFCIFVA
jgi:hypothetical protein